MENCVSFKVEIVLAFRDITKLDVHAIVNAAQSNLQAGGGVCGAVFRAAGRRQLQAECDRHGHCNTGDAVLTLSYDIRNVRNIIHAVGPKVPHGRVTTVHRRELASCYKQSLDLAKQHGLRSIVSSKRFVKINFIIIIGISRNLHRHLRIPDQRCH